MKQPFLSHCLAHAAAVTPELLDISLPHDRRLGFRGQVIVAAITRGGAQATIDVFKRHKMEALVCGFLPNGTPDPWEDPAGALKALESQFALAGDLAFAGVGPRRVVGPIHTQHRKMRSGAGGKDALARWLEALSKGAGREKISVCVEPLNDVEDGTENPFVTLFELIQPYDNILIQWDTGHAHARGLDAGHMLQMANWIGFLEFANVGRNPLDVDLGIDFAAYARAIGHLPHCRHFGAEPFDQSVIQAFGLSELCDTQTPGPEALARDAAFLRDGLQIMT